MSQLIERNDATPVFNLPTDDATETFEMNASAQTSDASSEVEILREQVAQGFMYSHSRENANTSKVLEVASFSYALIELLSERGVITVAELDERKKQVGQRLVEKFTEKGMGVALTNEEGDKYEYAREAKVDCENRMHLCRGACCRLRFALTVQDLEEGKVKWDLGHPYMIRHNAEGYCHHNERDTHRCTVYENRPIVCRAYDCSKDKRIWSDFENMVVSPDLANLFPKDGSASNNQPDAPGAQPSTPTLYQLTRNGAGA